MPRGSSISSAAFGAPCKRRRRTPTRPTEALRDTFVIVSAELARTYFELKGAQYRLSVAQHNAENQRQTFELTQALLAGGRGTDLDIARARAQLESTLASIPPLESDINSGAHRLAVLLGESPEPFVQALAARMPSCRRCRKSSTSATPRACCAGAPTCASRSTRCKPKRRASALRSADLFPRVSSAGIRGIRLRPRRRISAIAAHADDELRAVPELAGVRSRPRPREHPRREREHGRRIVALRANGA